jgi:hypothetical protein
VRNVGFRQAILFCSGKAASARSGPSLPWPKPHVCCSAAPLLIQVKIQREQVSRYPRWAGKNEAHIALQHGLPEGKADATAAGALAPRQAAAFVDIHASNNRSRARAPAAPNLAHSIRSSMRTQGEHILANISSSFHVMWGIDTWPRVEHRPARPTSSRRNEPPALAGMRAFPRQFPPSQARRADAFLIATAPMPNIGHSRCPACRSERCRPG